MKTARYAFTAAILLLAGCFSLERGEINTNGEEHVLVSNYGWKLFHFIPVICGNASRDPAFPCVILRNDVTLDKIQSRFMQYAEGQGKTPADMAYTTTQSVMLKLPGLDIPLPIPYLVTYHEIQLSGVLKNKGGEER